MCLLAINCWQFIWVVQVILDIKNTFHDGPVDSCTSQEQQQFKPKRKKMYTDLEVKRWSDVQDRTQQ